MTNHEAVRHLRPEPVELVAAVGEPDTALRRFRVYPEAHPEQAVLVEAFGLLDAMVMATEIWPDGDPWGCDDAQVEDEGGGNEG
jgi:hypothetical protein